MTCGVVENTLILCLSEIVNVYFRGGRNNFKGFEKLNVLNLAVKDNSEIYETNDNSEKGPKLQLFQSVVTYVTKENSPN